MAYADRSTAGRATCGGLDQLTAELTNPESDVLTEYQRSFTKLYEARLHSMLIRGKSRNAMLKGWLKWKMCLITGTTWTL